MYVLYTVWLLLGDNDGFRIFRGMELNPVVDPYSRGLGGAVHRSYRLMHNLTGGVVGTTPQKVCFLFAAAPQKL